MKGESDRFLDTAILLAAGKGRRLRPYTRDTPKPLLTYKNKPIIDYAINSLFMANIKQIIVITSYLEEQIIVYIKSKYKNKKISFHHQHNISGSANAIMSLKKNTTNHNAKYVLIAASDYAYTDNYIKDLVNFHARGSQDISVSLKNISKTDIINSSLTIFKNNRIKKIIEKPKFHNMTDHQCELIATSLIYILPNSYRNYLDKLTLSKRKEYELPELINLMINDGFIAKGLLQNKLANWEANFVVKNDGS